MENFDEYFYEHFSRGGTGITNFDIEDLGIYQEAIRRSGDTSLFIQQSPMSGSATANPCCSLHSNQRKDRSEFWAIYRQVAAEMGGTADEKRFKGRHVSQAHL